MRNILTILLFTILTYANAQVTFLPSASITPCLGERKAVSFQTTISYDSLHWLKQAVIVGKEDTLIVGPNITTNTSLVTLGLQLFYQGVKYPVYNMYIIPTQPFIFSLNEDTVTCIDDSVEIRVIDPNNSVAKITWHSNRSDFIPPTYHPVTGIPKRYKTEKEGKFWVTVTNLNETCTLIDSINIRKITPQVDLGPDLQTCDNDLPYLANLETTPTNSKYTWSFNNQTRSTKGIYPTESGLYTLTTISPAPNFCEASDEVQVTINSVPKVTLSPKNSTVCKGEIAVISNTEANTGLNYNTKWTSSTSLPIIDDGQESITVREAGKYTLTLENQFCSAQDSAVIEYFNFDVNLGNDYPDTCSNGSYTLKNLSANTEPSQTFYLWRTPTGNSLEREVIAKTKGDYILTVTSDSPQCSISDTVQVNLNPIPQFDLGENKMTDESFFTFDGTFNNEFPKSGFNYNWTSLTYDSTYSTISNLYLDKPGEHYVNLEITNKSSGCKSSDSFLIIIPEEPIISSHVMYIPDAISPLAANQENAKLKVQGPDIDTENFEFMLFNRWGEIIFESKDFDFMKYEGWDATDSNTDVQNGTYTYTTKGQFKDGKTFNLVGTVSILR